MSLFKILKGDSSRIDMSITPFHDGYAYFTPDDGGFYIDSEDNGGQRRIRINPVQTGTGEDAGLSVVAATLLASAWADGSQVLQIPQVTASSNGMIGMTQNITSEEVEATRAAGLYISGQGEGTLTITAFGQVPTIDLPVSVLIDSTGTVTVNCVLYADGWNEGRQTVAVSGLTAIGNGMIGLHSTMTDEQFQTVAAAGFYVCGQRDGELDIAAAGTIPSDDIPIVVILLD